jgi:hypothetical protein
VAHESVDTAPAEAPAAWPFPLDDPYPAYRAARADGAVQWDAKLGAWLVLSHESASAVLRAPEWSSDPRHNPELFERMGGTGPAAGLLSKMVLFADPPEHSRLRSLVSRSFTPRAVASLRRRIAAIVDAAMTTGGSIELMSEVAYPVPLAVICELLDVGTDTAELLRAETPSMAAMLDPLVTPAAQAAGAAASLALMLALVPIVAERRCSPGDDLLSVLLDALDPDEAIVMALLLLAAGHETTANLIGNGTLALLQHPDQAEQLRSDPSLAPVAVEELLRWDSPVQVTGRVALAETTLAGRQIAAGEQAIVVLGAANRDPAVFTDPDELEIMRQGPAHLAFGHGAHFCVGAALARAEGAEVLSRIVTGNWRLEDWGRAQSTGFRRLSHLVVRG